MHLQPWPIRTEILQLCTKYYVDPHLRAWTHRLNMFVPLIGGVDIPSLAWQHSCSRHRPSRSGKSHTPCHPATCQICTLHNAQMIGPQVECRVRSLANQLERLQISTWLRGFGQLQNTPSRLIVPCLQCIMFCTHLPLAPVLTPSASRYVVRDRQADGATNGISSEPPTFRPSRERDAMPSAGI